MCEKRTRRDVVMVSKANNCNGPFTSDFKQLLLLTEHMKHLKGGGDVTAAKDSCPVGTIWLAGNRKP